MQLFRIHFFGKFTSVADAAAVNPNGIKTLLANGLSTFLINGKSADIMVYENQKNPPS